MKTFPLPKIAYTLLLVLFTAAIWWLLYYAQFMNYDGNIGALVIAFFLSLIGTLIIAEGWHRSKLFIKQNSITTILFLLSSSPLTISLVFYNYVKIFGHLKQ